MRFAGKIALVAVVMSLSACATRPTVVSIVPPADLLADCTKRPVALETWGDLAVAYRTRDQDVDTCNADKAGLREWARRVTAGK